METQSKRLITILESVITMMKIDNSRTATYYREFLEYKLGQLNKPHEVAEIAQHIMNAYGGMGTFNDINLHKDRKPLKEEDKKFRELRNELYLICEDIIIEDRNK